MQANESNGTYSQPQPIKIGGWLIIVALSVYIFPFVNLFNLVESNILPFFNGGFSTLINKNSESYHPIYLPTILLETVSVLILVVLGFLNMLFFASKDHRFPKFKTYELVLNFLSALFVLVCVSIYPHPDSATLDELMKTALRSAFAMMIWGSYFYRSLRVRSTFVKQYNYLHQLKSKVAFYSPIIVIGFLFLVAVGNRKQVKPLHTSEKSVLYETGRPQVEIELSSKEIADLALENLVVLEPKDKKGNIIGVGSGFFILPDLLVTNAHVISDAYGVTVRRPNSRIEDNSAVLVAIDKTADIALLRTQKITSKSPLKIGDPDRIAIGTKIYTAGNPRGIEGTFSDGLISNKQSYNGIDVVQISAPISPGSSGGPVLDSNGKLIAVSSAIIPKGQNLNITIPSFYISRLIMRSDSFYPLVDNIELEQNLSIEGSFSQVCSHLIDVDLPPKHFIEISKNDLKNKSMQEFCGDAMPSCKRAWYNNKTKGAVFVGSTSLKKDLFKGASQSGFEKLTGALVDKFKASYRASNPETQFKVSTKDMNSSTYRIDIEASYRMDGDEYVDRRNVYFVLPYCRFDVLYVSHGPYIKLDEAVHKIMSDLFAASLPGIHSEKALFKFEK